MFACALHNIVCRTRTSAYTASRVTRVMLAPTGDRFIRIIRSFSIDHCLFQRAFSFECGCHIIFITLQSVVCKTFRAFACVLRTHAHSAAGAAPRTLSLSLFGVHPAHVPAVRAMYARTTNVTGVFKLARMSQRLCSRAYVVYAKCMSPYVGGGCRHLRRRITFSK